MLKPLNRREKNAFSPATTGAALLAVRQSCQIYPGAMPNGTLTMATMGVLDISD